MSDISHANTGKPVSRRDSSKRGGRALLRQLHLILALGAGLFLAVVGASGSLLIFKSEIGEPAASVTESALDQAPLSLDRLVAKTQQALPDLTGPQAIALPPDNHSPVTLLFRSDLEKTTWRVHVDPYSGDILAETPEIHTWLDWVYDLHAKLLIEGPGITLVGLLGILLLLSAISGLLLWWPGKAGLRQALAPRMPRRPMNKVIMLHKLIGGYGALLLILIAATGSALAFRAPLQIALEGISPATPWPTRGEMRLEKTCTGATTLEDALYLAEQALPGGMVTRLRIPGRASAPYVVAVKLPEETPTPLGQSRVWIDRNCAEVLAVRDSRTLNFGDRAVESVLALHNGQSLGWTGRLLYVAAGFLPLFFFVSGLLMWLRRKS